MSLHETVSASKALCWLNWVLCCKWFFPNVGELYKLERAPWMQGCRGVGKSTLKSGWFVPDISFVVTGDHFEVIWHAVLIAKD